MRRPRRDVHDAWAAAQVEQPRVGVDQTAHVRVVAARVQVADLDRRRRESGLDPDLYHDQVFHNAPGCEECGGTGFHGRTAVAELLDMSAHTVTTHVKRIYQKLAVHSRGEAVYEATQMGLLRH